MQTNTKHDWQPHSEEVLHNQRQAYDQMRRQCPVARHADRQWTIFRHQDVMQVLLEHEKFSNQVSRHISVPNGTDPPQHTGFRRLIEPFFTAERVAWFAPVCREIATDLASNKLQADATELMKHFARPFAARLQCAFMGWPQQLSHNLLDWLDRNQAATLQQDRQLLADLAEEFNQFTGAQIQQRREQKAASNSDITSELMHAKIDGRPLSQEEITSILRNWTAGEVSTIAAAIGIIAHYLACHPHLQQQLRQTPDKLWYANDEILRMHNPLLENRRRTTCPVQLGERQIEQDSILTINWVAANRDPLVFEQADKFSWERDPAQNLLYGAGIHVCPGAPLARMELVTAIEVLLAHSSNLQLVPNQCPVYARYPASGYAKLHVRLHC